MTALADSIKCFGCGSCANTCPSGSIEMKRDHEGFLYPLIKQEDCTGCGLCMSVCPAESVHFKDSKAIAGYIAQHKDDSIRRQSTSGGAFSAIASEVFLRGGVVIGASVGEHNNVVHTAAYNENELAGLRMSKYVQSDIGGIYDLINDILATDKLVLFSGTPCQVAAMRKRFHNEKLLLIDVACREVASPRLLEKYVCYLQEKFSAQLKEIFFRSKYYGYHYPVIEARFDSGYVYRKPLHYDPYLRAFFSDCFARPSCYNCPFRKGERQGDLTIYDAWDISNCNELVNDDMGATKIIVSTEKGKEIISACSNLLRLQQVNARDLLDEQDEYMVPYDDILEFRDSFWSDADTLSEAKLFHKYFPVTLMHKLRFLVKRTLYECKFYKRKKRFI